MVSKAAQALNLRDSGLKVRVGNRKDMYTQNIKKDGFKLLQTSRSCKLGRYYYVFSARSLAEVYKEWIKPYLKSGNVMVFAHGYCLYYNRIILPEDVDVVLLAQECLSLYKRSFLIIGEFQL